MRKWKQDAGHEITSKEYSLVIENIIFGIEKDMTSLCMGLEVLQKLYLVYKENEETDWLFRFLQYDLKDADPLLLVVSTSGVFLDFTLNLTAHLRPKLFLNPAEPNQLFLSLALFSFLSLTSKGRDLL